jgi:hypothetical protein
MSENVNIMDILSKKTREEIELFITNSFLSVDEEKRKQFESIITKVIIDSTINSKINKN